jgi:hypothetical protein
LYKLDTLLLKQKNYPVLVIAGFFIRTITQVKAEVRTFLLLFIDLFIYLFVFIIALQQDCYLLYLSICQPYMSRWYV